MSRVAVVVVNFRSSSDTIRCVRSLLTVSMPLRLFVVENASGDGSAEQIAREVPEATLLVSDTNLGYAGGNNLGIEVALAGGAEYVLVINPDVEVIEPSFVDVLVQALEADLRAGLAGPIVLLPDGSRQPTNQRRPSFWLALALGLSSKARRAGAPERAGRVPTVNGVCLLVRRAALEATGGFDPRYFMYCEEADLAERAERAGYHSLFVPVRSIVHHHPEGDVRSLAALQIRKNFVRFCFDHRSASSGVATALLFLLAAALRDLHRGVREELPQLLRALDEVVPGGTSRRALASLALDVLVVPALVIVLVLLLALGSSRLGPLRSLAAAGKFGALGTLAAAAAASLLLDRNRARLNLRSLAHVLLAAAAVFIGVCAASIAWSDDPRHSFHFTLALVLLLGGSLAVSSRVAGRPGGAKMLANALLAGLAIIVVADAAALVFDHSGSFARDVGTTQRFRGLLESPNTIAAYAFLVPLAVWRVTTVSRLAPRVIGAMLVVAYLAEIVLSGTRLALVMVALTVGLFALASLGGRRAAVAAATLVLCAATAITMLAVTKGGNEAGLPRYVRPSSLPTLSGRTEAWAAAGKLIEMRPLTGYGIGEESAVFVRYQAEQARAVAVCVRLQPLDYCESDSMRRQRLADFSGEYVHNSFFGVAMQVGAPVAVAWALLLLTTVMVAARAVGRRERLRPALVAAMVGGLIWAFYSTYLWSPGNVVAGVFWIIVGAAVARDPRGTSRVPE